VFLPAIFIQASSGLRGAHAQVGVVVAGAVLAVFAAALFSACLRLAHRVQPRGQPTNIAFAAAIGTACAGVVALAFLPLALLLRLAGYLVPRLRYTLAPPEQFLYAVALHPATGATLVVLALVSSYWAFMALSASSSSNVAAPNQGNAA
jgi:hypothetical protein